MSLNLKEKQFEQKYHLYSQMLFKISYGYTHNREDAEDVVQEVFMKYLKKAPLFLKPHEEKYWLIRVAINESISLTRKAHKKNVEFDEEIQYNKSDSQENNLKLLVMTLPNKIKNAIILYYYNNLSAKEIASVLKITEAAVMKRMERGRRMLRELMEEN